jgi:hypothetical protein
MSTIKNAYNALEHFLVILHRIANIVFDVGITMSKSKHEIAFFSLSLVVMNTNCDISKRL